MQLEKFKLREQKNTLKRISSPQYQSEKGEKKYQILISMDIEFIGYNGKQLWDVEKDWIQNQLSIEASESDFITWQIQNMELQQMIYQRIQRESEENQKIDSCNRFWTRNQRAKFLTFLWAYWERLNFEKKIKRPMFRRISYFVGTKDEQACENRYRSLRIIMIGTLTGIEWWIYDSFKTTFGLGTTGGGSKKDLL